jgi:hypothetical protein
MMKEYTYVQFIGLELDKSMNQKDHIEKILLKISNACHVVRSMYHFSSMTVINMICFAYQYSETNVMHFLFNLLRTKGPFMFRALLAHPQEQLHNWNLVYCVCYVS